MCTESETQMGHNHKWKECFLDMWTPTHRKAFTISESGNCLGNSIQFKGACVSLGKKNHCDNCRSKSSYFAYWSTWVNVPQFKCIKNLFNQHPCKFHWLGQRDSKEDRTMLSLPSWHLGPCKIFVPLWGLLLCWGFWLGYAGGSAGS